MDILYMNGININNKGKKEKNAKIKEGPCIIPFKYKWKTHDKCFKTPKGDICATSVSKYGTLQTYGYCEKYGVEKGTKKKALQHRKSIKPIKPIKSSNSHKTLKKKRVKKIKNVKLKLKKKSYVLTNMKPIKTKKEYYNEKFIKLLGELYTIMMAKGEHYRARAYKKAQETIMSVTSRIENVDVLKGKPGIGSTTISKLNEFVKTGTLRLIEREKSNPIHIFTKVYGIGPKKAQELVSEYNIKTIDELRSQQDLLNDKQKIGLKYYEDILKRIPRGEIDEYKKTLTSIFNSIKTPGSTMEIVGSYRRGLKTSGDIDIIISNKHGDKSVFNAFLAKLIENNIIIETLSHGAVKSLVIAQLPGKTPRRVDFLYSSPEEYAFSILYFTGSAIFNTVMRKHALNLGYTMNEHGLYKMDKRKKGAKVDVLFPTEKSIFEFLGLVYKTPSERIDGRAIEMVPTETTNIITGKQETITTPKAPKAPKRIKKLSKKITLKRKPRITSVKHIQNFIDQGIDYLHTLSQTELSSMLKKANSAYYNEKPLMIDSQYDILKEYIEEHHPHDKVLQEVGAPIEKGKVKLPYYMGSMDKIKPDTGAITKWKATYKGPYCLSGKLDGISALYTTEHGEKKLYTRGNGIEGQDISYMIPYLMLPTEENIVIRGELIMAKKVFEEKYKTSASNARNLVAGISNRKTIYPAEIRDIDFVAYEVIVPELKPSKQMEMLEKSNVKTVINTLITKPSNLTNALLSEKLIAWRTGYMYEVDGVICTNDQIYPRKKGNPKYAFAFKMVLSDQVVEAKVVDVLWAPTKYGYIKPRIRIEPVIIGGARIEYATAFNAAFVEANKIGIGAVIQLVRSGDVIPHIMEVITPAPVAKMPDVPYKWNDTHVDIILLDATTDTIVQAKTITAFFTGLNVTGLSSGNVKRIIKAGFDTIPKILAMSVSDFLLVDGFKEKMANKIHTSIQEKIKESSLPKLMSVTNIFGRGMGERRITAILKEFPNILTSKESSSKKALKLMSIKGFGSKTAALFVEHISEFMKFVTETGLEAKLTSAIKEVKADAKKTEALDTSHELYGKRILMTGFRDKELEKQIVAVGGKIATSVSKTTFAVLVKDIDEDTGKANKARELGVKLMTPFKFKTAYKLP